MRNFNRAPSSLNLYLGRGAYCAYEKCALGCADGAVDERLDTYYKASSDDDRIDFNFCHPLWQEYYITIDPPSRDNEALYYALGSIASLINIAALSAGFYFVYGVAREKGIIGGITDGNCKKKICSLWQLKKLLLPILMQVLDSLLDSIYFINLKTSYRIVQVPPSVHVAQGILLLTCKLVFRSHFNRGTLREKGLCSTLTAASFPAHFACITAN